ncbi:MAG: hypothetical protein HFJ47_04535 [Clostridia bacterium]|nr:hypothetical protein [Clostridia bacterium]
MAINFTSRSRIESLNKLAEGGEATIYEYDSKRVIKVFKPKVDLARKKEKVNYFISIKNQLPRNVIGPEEEVTVQGKFVGYAMRKLVGAEDLHMLTKPKYLTAAHLSNQDVLQIITDFGKHLGELHSTGIIVGDVSDYNFQINGKCDYFIDVDSWGIEGKYTPDAYTELFTCPDSYSSSGSINFSIENENYNFAILAFNMLTRIHPFGGTYLPDKNLSTIERMKRKISIVGKHKGDIKIPKIIGSWKWMSPQLEKDFLEIFEQGKKIDITANLQELLKNMKYCSTHDIYYYSKFNECPLCNENAKVKTAPVVAKVTQTANGPQITVIFAGIDCAYVLSNVHYLNRSNEAVHFETVRKFTVERGKRVDFSNDGKVVFVTDDDSIQVYDENNQVAATIERMHKSNYLVKDRDLYYVDKGNNLVRLSITKSGNMPNYLGQVFNAFFEASDDGKVLIVSMYPKTAIITTPDYTFEVDYNGRINEYAIKYDRATQKWLFVYQLSNGKYRTMVFNKNRIEYDDDVIMYNAQPLVNIDFCNNTIYDPADGKIIGTNIVKNTAKEFNCGVVDESSRLQFTGRGFKIYNKNNIYNYG